MIRFPLPFRSSFSVVLVIRESGPRLDALRSIIFTFLYVCFYILWTLRCRRRPHTSHPTHATRRQATRSHLASFEFRARLRPIFDYCGACASPGHTRWQLRLACACSTTQWELPWELLPCGCACQARFTLATQAGLTVYRPSVRATVHTLLHSFSQGVRERAEGLSSL